MEEPKRRARRAQQAQLEEQTSVPAEPLMQESPSPHRRRRQQILSEEQPEKAEYSEEQKPKPNKKAGFGRVIIQTFLGMAALLAMAGAAVLRAAKRLHTPKQKPEDLAKSPKAARYPLSEILRLAAMALCMCVAVVSAWQVGSIVLRSVRTRQLNASLSQQRQAAIEERQAMEEDACETFAVFAAEDTPRQDDALQFANEPLLVSEPQPEEDLEPASEIKTEAAAAPDVVRTTKYRQVGGDALPEMAQLHGQNHDLVAWIQIPDVLDLPVVYRDNSYYLTRDFARQKNASGTIFLDENHPFKEKTQNLLLHGHNMKDGTMFGRLTQYLSDDTYLRNHPFIYFDTLWQKEQYVIFAVLDVSLKPGDTRFFNYFTHDIFSSDAEFAMYIRQLQLRSKYAIPIDVEPSDALLTLSTCLEDDRLVIVARRLRGDETRSQLRTLIRMATKQ